MCLLLTYFIKFTLGKPVNASPDSRVDINAHRVLYNNALTSSYEELSRGGGIRYKASSVFFFFLFFF